MYIDHRTYTVKPGRVKDFLEHYERHGLPIQLEHLGEPLGWYTTEVGNVNQVVHLWAYKDLDDRAKRRAAMMGDPRWPTYFARVSELIDLMENKLLRPASFAPVKPR